MSAQPARTIVLTGGPCSGKSTALSYLQEKLSDFGFQALCTPETATIFIKAGVKPAGFTPEQMMRFEEILLQNQIYLENSLKRLSLLHPVPRGTVLICDRGCMDAKAYLSKNLWQKTLQRNHWTETNLRDQRYDAVFHLVTAADGKEEFYTTENNSARSETPEQARRLDSQTQAVWLGHPHLRVIDNSTGFPEKLQRLLHQIQRFLGIPVALEIEKKFLLSPWFPNASIPIPYQEIVIEQLYLKNQNDQTVRRLRKRWQRNSGAVYYFTIKKPTGKAGVNIETEKHILEKQFRLLLKEADPNKRKVVKQRFCFLWKNQYFELDVFLEPKPIAGLSLLEIELTEENDTVEIPDWLGPVKEVTGDPRYQNVNIAQIT